MPIQFTDLDPAAQPLVKTAARSVVIALISSRGALSDMRRAVADWRGAGQAAAIAQLDPAATIPNSGQPGAVDQPESVYEQLVEQFEALLSTWDSPTVRALHSQLIGAQLIEGAR